MITLRRRPLLLGLAAATLGACKRNRAPELAEVWDEDPALARTEAAGALAPPWPQPVRGQLDDGLLTFWLHESGGAAMHVRLLVPTSVYAEGPTGEVIAIAAEHARHEWQRRVQRFGVSVAIEHGPHRVELCASGPDTQLTASIAALRTMLAQRNPAGLDGARARVREQVPARTSLEVAAAATTRRLLGIDEAVDVGRIDALAAAALAQQWHALTDPRQCVLVIHAPMAAEDGKAELRRLADAWRGPDLGRGGQAFIDRATLRLRRRVEFVPTGTRLLAASSTPLVVDAAGRGGGTLVLGRTIPLGGADDRAMARLAQRIAQEELDASIAICGDVAVFLVAANLGRGAPESDVTQAVDALAAIAKTRQPRQRLFGAVQLWLGARVVEASLHGEDWTELFADAIDLADTDAGIADALAADAARQLAIAPDGLEQWTQRWLDPRTGEPGWAWTAAGVDGDAAARIERVAPRT